MIEENEVEKEKEVTVLRRMSVSESKASRAATLKEMRKHQPMFDQTKKDILEYLDNLIKSVDWLVLSFCSMN